MDVFDYSEEGISDAEKGVYELPYPESEDPLDEIANFSYESSWKRRRWELGDKFKWSE
jgi:hypothetical protein